MPYVGQPLKRFEDHRLLTGGGSYLDDMTMPEMVHAVFVRSTHASATIGAIDVATARALPGVVAVITGKDIAEAVDDIPHRDVPEMEGVKIPGHPALARDKVCYVGQPIAMVIAEEGRIGATARKLFDAIIAADPFNPKARYYLGLEKAQQGNVRGALQAWVDLAALSDADEIGRAHVRTPVTSLTRMPPSA